MAKLKVNEVFTRLVPKYGEIFKLIHYIYNVQKTDTARLDFSATAKALGTDWKTVKRLCDKLAKAEIIYYDGAGLRLNADIIVIN